MSNTITFQKNGNGYLLSIGLPECKTAAVRKINGLWYLYAYGWVKNVGVSYKRRMRKATMSIS
jgi:hypothetical protein